MLGSFSSRNLGAARGSTTPLNSEPAEVVDALGDETFQLLAQDDEQSQLLAQVHTGRHGQQRACLVASLVACIVACVGAAFLVGARSHQAAAARASISGKTSETGEFLALASLNAAASGVCSKVGENCAETGCCAEPGFQCYEKDATYAGCRGFCTSGGNSTWSCREIGTRAAKPEGVNFCSWAGENCAGTQCCNDANMKCFTKDEWFGGCHFNKQDGWTNNEIGQFRGWAQTIAPVATNIAGTKLYCITVQSPDQPAQPNRPATHDGALLGAIQAKGLGIFACDMSDVFMGSTAPKAEWQSISNTDIFIQIWEQVKLKGNFWHADWTAKLDPDAVFFPHRLKSHLAQLKPPADTPIYIKNSNFKFGFMGSLEIFSEKAMEVFIKDGHHCKDKIGHTGGEDFFIMTCMDALGVGSMADAQVLDDKYTRVDHLVLDDVTPCHNGWTAAFHPYKDVNTWMSCHQAAVDTENAWSAAHPTN